MAEERFTKALALNILLDTIPTTSIVDKVLESDTYTGMIIKGDNGWVLKIDSIEFSKVFNDDQIKDILNNTLSDAHSGSDFANDGEKYLFDVSKFDNYVIDDIDKFDRDSE